MKILSLTILVFVTNSIFAIEQRGCITRNGNSVKIDEKCTCISTNTCAKIKNFKLDEDLYAVTDKNKRPLFNANEKAKMRESFKTYDEIVKLKLAGKGNTPEIKALYIKLDSLNNEVRKSFLKTQSSYLSTSKNNYSKYITKNRKTKEKQFQLAMSSLSSSKPSIAASPVSPSKENVKKNTSVEYENNIKSTSKIYGSNNKNEESEFILKNLQKEEKSGQKLDRKEEDSLFDIVSKGYKRAAYPILLAP